MAFVNMTGQAIVVRVPGRPDNTLAAAARPSSFTTKDYPADYVDGVPTVRREMFNLDIPDDGLNDTDLVVVDEKTFEVAQLQGHPLKDRLVYPDHGNSAVRSGWGAHVRVEAVTQFIRPGTGEVAEADANPQGQAQSAGPQAERDKQNQPGTAGAQAPDATPGSQGPQDHHHPHHRHEHRR